MDNGTIAMFVFGATMAVGLPWHLQGLIARMGRRSAVADGKVVGVAHADHHAQGFDDFGPGTWHAVVAFDAGGRSHRFETSYGVSWKKPQIGSSARVRYDPRDPANAEVDHGQRLALARAMQVVAAVAGVALVAAAVVAGG